ncbi:MAG: type III polyketide synthase [Ignavibacteria bacterium]|nr:type III polyketide synthase [Ignavibacteria bacterium]
MSEIISVSKIDLPYRIKQSDMKAFSRETFFSEFSDIDRLLESFDNAMIDFRNLAVPLEYFSNQKTFKEKNDLYIELALKYSIEAIEKSLINSGFQKEDITDIVFISSTGISTPSIDALIINKMKLDPYTKRIPVWGLGCAGGVAGLTKANTIAVANPEAVVVVVAVELCSLTFIREDISKSNLIATGLFSDGISSVIIKGNKVNMKSDFKINILDSQSKLYYDSLDVMGWDVLDTGLKVIFSKDIPSIVNKSVKDDVNYFLNKHNLNISDIKNFIVHPGGKKVIEAYIDALKIEPDNFNNTRKILKDYGNMSSATVLYVLNEFISNGFEDGYGLMMSLGPGFSSEMMLLQMKNHN